MIVTITPNTALDHISFVPIWGFDATLRATLSMESIAGKPTDASYILAEMGISSVALGFKAGHNGQIVEQILQRKNVTTRFVEVQGETRRNLVLIYQEPPGQTTITSSTLSVVPAQQRQLETSLRQVLSEASCVVMGGTLPDGIEPDYYQHLISIVREVSIPIILDTSGEYLRRGLVAQPTYIKPNRDELSELVGWQVTTINDAYRAGQTIHDQYGVNVIVSLGKEGGLAILDSRAYYIPPIKVEVINTAGAGDAVIAGIAASIEQQLPIEDGLRLGFGAATAVVTQQGTAECTRSDIERYASLIQLQAYQEVISQ